jgi:uncharacterized protein YjaG (DUF416 family)
MNSIVTFDQAEVESRLSRLSVEKRVIFAASCATRLVPGYLEFNDLTGVGDPERLRYALECAWKWAGGDRKAADFRQVAANIEPLQLDEDAIPSPVTAAAEDAARAVAYVVDTILEGRAAAASFAGSVAYEAVDQRVMSLQRKERGEPGSEEQILTHPLVQVELARQLRDLVELENSPDRETNSIASKFKIRAESENAFALAL